MRLSLHYLEHLIYLTRDWRPDGERDRAQSQDESDALRRPDGTADLEGDWPEHGDEAAVEEAHDEREHHHQLEGVVAEVGRRCEQHGAEPDGNKRDLMPEFNTTLITC